MRQDREEREKDRINMLNMIDRATRNMAGAMRPPNILQDHIPQRNTTPPKIRTQTHSTPQTDNRMQGGEDSSTSSSKRKRDRDRDQGYLI